VNNQLTVLENEQVSGRKTRVDDAARRARGDEPLNPFEARDAALERHQQAVDEAVAAGEITPEQATDPVVRALVADAQVWRAGERGGGMARAREAAGGATPREGSNQANKRARGGARRAGRLGEEPPSPGEANVENTVDASFDQTFGIEPTPELNP